MSRRAVRVVAWCLTSPLLGACRGAAPRAAPPPAPTVAQLEVPELVSRWPSILADALRASADGRFSDADRQLHTYAIEQAGNAEGLESDFWRALLRADPSNTAGSARDAKALLDGYLAAGPGTPRFAEAQVLRRLVEAVDSSRTAVSSLRSTSEAREHDREEEIKRLTEELEKTVAELERIKRRLVPEKKPPVL